jgi:hypothetical protein
VAQASNSADHWALLRATTLLCGSRCGGHHSAQIDARQTEGVDDIAQQTITHSVALTSDRPCSQDTRPSNR